MRTLLLSVFLIGCFSCDPNKKNNGDDTTTVNVTPEELKALQDRDLEKHQPGLFIMNSCNYNKTLFGRMNINVTFHNIANYTTYKDINFKVIYKSKTNTVLGTKNLVYYEYLKPDASFNGTFKVDIPKATDAIEIKVISATIVNQI